MHPRRKPPTLAGVIAVLLIALGLAGAAVVGAPRAAAVQAQRAPVPQACEGYIDSQFDPTHRYRVFESGQYGSTVGGLGVAGRTCYRSFNYISHTALNQGPQDLFVGRSIPLSVSYYGELGPNIFNDPVKGPILTGWNRNFLVNAQQPAAFTWDINSLFEAGYEPAMRDLGGNLGSTVWASVNPAYQKLFTIAPSFDMSGCINGVNQGRRVPVCTIKLLKGPYYPTGTTGQIPWTLIQGWHNSAGSSTLPQLVPNYLHPDQEPSLTRYDEYLDAPVWIEPSPYARQHWTTHPDDLLTVDFDGSGSLYNGTIDRFEWTFASEDGSWFRDDVGPQLTQTFPGVGNYNVTFKIYADGQTDLLTGQISIGYNAGGLSVNVDSARDNLRVDTTGNNAGQHESVTITVTNTSDTDALNVTLNQSLFSVPGQPAAQPTLGFAGTPPAASFYNLGTIAAGGAVTRTFEMLGLRAGKGRVVAEVGGGAKAEKGYTIAADCRMGSGATCPYTPPVDYLTPFANGGGGSPQFGFNRGPGAEVTRQGPNGLQAWNGTAWANRANPKSGETLAIAPQTWTPATAAGATTSPIVDPNSYGGNPGSAPLFQPGDHVIINPGGANQERRTVTALGSLIYGQALTFAHTHGEMITLDPTTTTDTVAPTVVMNAPTINQIVAGSPVTISGTAADNVGVVSVGVAVYRNVAGGQYWNGTAWQAANTTTAAVLGSPGGKSTTWSYTFNGPPGGVFATAAVASDAAGKYGVAGYQTFAVSDLSNPNVTLTSPTAGQAFAGRPVSITGTATDNAGVGDVQIAVYRPVDPAGQFWNGSAWQAAYTTVTATMASPGATSTAFTYSFNPPQSGGLFYAAAVVLDTSYHYNLTAFTPFTLPDPTPPAATIISPLNGATTSGTFTITGTATDNVSVNSVGVAIYRASTGEYYNGTTWQAGFATVPATLTTPGATSTGFTRTFTPPAAGYYLIAALPIDGNYNYTLTSFNTITAT